MKQTRLDGCRIAAILPIRWCAEVKLNSTCNLCEIRRDEVLEGLLEIGGLGTLIT